MRGQIAEQKVDRNVGQRRQMAYVGQLEHIGERSNRKVRQLNAKKEKTMPVRGQRESMSFWKIAH